MKGSKGIAVKTGAILALLALVLVSVHFVVPVFATDYCGQTLGSDTTFDADLNCGPTSGIQFSASNIVVNCAGHIVNGSDPTITGTAAFYIASFSNITIKNCIIRTWRFGVNIDGSDNNTIFNNTMNNSQFGIYINHDNVAQPERWNNITGNNVSYAADDIALTSQAEYNIFKNNVVSDSPYDGFLVNGGSHNVFINNAAGHNNRSDFYVTGGATNNTVINLSAGQNNLVSFTAKDILMVGRDPQHAPPDQPGYRNISQWIDTTNSSSANNWIWLNFSYRPEDMGGMNENLLQVSRFNGTTWELNTSKFATSYGVDNVSKVVYANITNFSSTFAPLGPGDTAPPIWSANQSNITTPYSSAPSRFNISWADNTDVSIVQLESNFSGSPQNYTMTNATYGGSIYNYSVVLPAGLFYWKSWANDTSGNNNFNVSDTWYFNVVKATPAVGMLINPTSTVTYPTTTVANASLATGDLGANISLYSNASGSLLLVNSTTGYWTAHTMLWGAGTIINYTATYNGTQNYTAITSYNIAVIQPNTSTADFMNLTINGTESNKAYPFPSLSNATGWYSTAVFSGQTITFTLYRNDTSVGTTNPVNDTDSKPADTYIYTYNTSGNSNYSTATKAYSLIIGQIANPLTLTVTPGASVTYPTVTTANCSALSGTPTLYRNGTAVSNTTNETMRLGAKAGGAEIYNYTCNISATANYTANATYSILSVAQNSSTANYMNLTINATESNKSYNYGSVSNATAWNTLVGNTQNFTLIRAPPVLTIGSDTNPISDVIVLGGSTTYPYIYNFTGNANYSAASKTYNLQINQSTVPLTLFINGTDGDKTLNESASGTVAVNFTVVPTFVGVPSSQPLELWTNFTGSNIQWINASSQINNITTLGGLGVYNWTAYFPAENNFTFNTTTHYLTIADNTPPAVYLGSPGNFTGTIGPGFFNTSSGVLSFVPNDLHLKNCSLWTNFTGSWAPSSFMLNGTNLTNGITNNFTVGPLTENTSLWNVKCYDTSGNLGINNTNYTLRVSFGPMFNSVYTNDTDNFYSNCTNNNLIRVVANLTQAGLNVTANFNAIEGNNTIINLTDKGSGIYTGNYTITNALYAFEAKTIIFNATNSLGQQNLSGTAAVIYNMTIPDPSLGGVTTNMCNVTNFGAIPGMIFERVGYGKIVFIDNINLSTPEQGGKLANLSANLNITNKTVGINSAYFTELKHNATLYMYNTQTNLTQNLTYIPEGSSDAQVCTGSICIAPSWNNTTNITTFNITTFSKFLADDAAPNITSVGPTGTLTSASVTLTATTDEIANCRYSTTNVAYDNMTTAFTTTNVKSHSQILSLGNGAYTYFVRCRDIVNNTNTNSANTSFTVSVTTTPSSGGGGGGSYTTNTSTMTTTIASIAAGDTATVPVDTANMPITEIAVTAATNVTNVQVTMTSTPTQPTTISIGAPGSIYTYLAISTTTLSSSISEIKVEFKVPKSWITANNIDVTTISLNHYVNGVWTALPTSQVSSDADYFYFSATTSSLSYFAITGRVVGVAPPVAGCPTCPLPGEWSDCANEEQTRTNYRCSADTNYACESYSETQACVISAPISAPAYAAWIVAIVAIVLIFGYTAYTRMKKPGYQYRKWYHR